MPFVDSTKVRVRDALRRVRFERDKLLYGNCLVLLYHRVMDLPTDPQMLAVSPSHFDAQLAYVKEHYRVLSVAEFDEHLLGRKRFPRNAVFITFDDGYADNHEFARPLLEKHGLQGLFYISSHYVGADREFWWDELERILLLNPNIPADLDFERKGIELKWSFGDQVEIKTLRERYEQLLIRMRIMPSADRDEFLAEMRTVLKSESPRTTHLAMTPAQLKDFARSSSVVIGAHSRLHPSLAYITEAEQQVEVQGSKNELEAMLGVPITYFAYPFGTPTDFSSVTKRITSEAGFIHAAANDPGIVHSRSAHFGFQRLLIRNWDIPTFRKAISKYLD